MSELFLFSYSFVINHAPSDDDDEDEESNSVEPLRDEEGNVVKPEPGEASLSNSKESPTELHIYTMEELARFKKKELLADVTYLEGMF